MTEDEYKQLKAGDRVTLSFFPEESEQVNFIVHTTKLLEEQKTGTPNYMDDGEVTYKWFDFNFNMHSDYTHFSHIEKYVPLCVDDDQ